MQDDIKLPPLPEWMSNYTIPADDFAGVKVVMLDDRMHDYARANVAVATAMLQAEVEALRAEVERLNRYYKNGIDCFANPCERHSGERTPPFAEFFEKYGGQCLICVVDNNKALQAECERLRKDAERYRWLCDQQDVTWQTYGGKWIGASGSTLREIIDAAMSKEGRGDE